MALRITALISALGVVPGVLLLVLAVREYRSGGSALRIAAGAAILLGSLYACVRDMQRLRSRPSA
ncbi:hypothetical protein ACF053_27445 [Streptomyces kanasensis]|uniref:hypothetical protein n=1 Tax=Streptomyces kanasensis TaxID=936756 RepID=UPI0036FA945F